MRRSLQLLMVALATALVVSACGLLTQSSLPPLGDVDLASITPPKTELAVLEQSFCDPAIPGYFATGSTSLTPAELQQWYLDRFEPTDEEATARFNAQPGLRGPMTIFDDFSMWAADTSDGEGVTDMFVQTYATTQHECMPNSVDQWNLTDAWSGRNPCDHDQILIDLWGVKYHENGPAQPPDSAAMLAFDDGRKIAHGTDDLTHIFVLDGPMSQWTEYEMGDCGVE